MSHQLLPAGTGVALAVLSRKGGSGKTTVSSAIASGLALRGYRTLLGEFEDNTRLFHQTTGYSQLGGEQPPLDSQTMYGLVRNPDYGLPPVGDIDVARQFGRVPHLSKEFVAQLSVQRGWTHPQAMDLLPGSESLADLETQFAAELATAQAHGKPLPAVYTRLAQGMALVRPHYDVVLLDTMASISNIQLLAALATHYLLIVVDFDVDSIEDYLRTKRFVEKAQSIARSLRMNEPQVLGVVFSKFDRAFEENDGRLYFSYKNEHTDPRTKQRRAPLIPDEELGLLALDRRTLAGAVNERVSMHTWAPTSQLGRDMFTLCCTLEARLGLARYNASPILERVSA